MDHAQPKCNDQKGVAALPELPASPRADGAGAAAEELRSLISEAADVVFAIGRATLSEQQVDRAYTAAERLLDYRDRNLSAARPPAPEAQGAEISQAALDVLAERRRQVEAEGWTPEHDDTHNRGELASAAACYATELDLWTGYEQADRKGRATLISAKRVWPWSGWWKPTDRRRNLVKAGALILAEIERLDRLPAPPASSGQ